MLQYLGTWTVCYGAGCVGGLAAALIAWFCGALEIPHHYGVRLAPELSSQYLYSNVVWGGLWGLSFSAPVMTGYPLARGAAISLAPAAVHLFLILPILQHKGIMGYHLGDSTYFFIIAYYLIWGMVAAYWIRLVR